MKTKKSTSAKEENIARLRSYSTMFAVLGMSAMILFAVFSLMSNAEPIQNSPTVSNLPALQGESAITHLKENKIYDSLAEAAAAARYQVDFADTGATAKNYANNLQMNFTDDGLQLKSTAKDKNWISNWRLSSFGYGTNQTAAADGSWQTAENRVELRRASPQITEWFVNQPNGLEHGFTLAARPDLENNGEALRLVIKLDGDLTAQADENGQALTLIEGDGAKALRYEKLKVWDADGRDLTARMRTEAVGGEVWLEVEDAAAIYPITIDPTFVETQKLTANNNDSLLFGTSIAIEGDTAVIGAPGGAAFIFVRNSMTWIQQQRLTPSDGGSRGFGSSVAISGDTLIIGAATDTISAINQGSAYIFVRNGTTWMEQQKITSSDGAMGCSFIEDPVCHRFGSSVAILGNMAIVGAPANVNGTVGPGAAYVFVRNGTTWTQQQRLSIIDGTLDNGFGNSVAIEGDTLVIGTPSNGFEPTGMRRGAAYIFVRNGTTWTLQQRLTASDLTQPEQFGNSVAISGETVVVGAVFDGSGKNFDQGSAYVFVRNGTTWTQQQKITASDGIRDDRFGFSVAILGDTAIVGAEGDGGGSAYVFVRSGTIWTEQQKLTASDAEVNDRLGTSVAILGETVIAGAPNDDIGATENQGSAYVFQFNATPTPTPTPTSTPTPTLGNYPDTTVVVGSNTTITPDAAPKGATSINVSTNSNFKGTFAANPTTGVVRVTNAHPAGTYLVTVKAFKEGEMATKTFTLTVSSGTVCNDTTIFDNGFDVSTDFRPNSVAIGDFNNDGNQDLLTPNRISPGTVSVRLGDGAGNFSGTTNISVSQNPTKIAVGDFNNDGNLDFASASETSRVSIRLGDGNGNFNGTTDIIVAGFPVDIVTADFNNDGNLDLAVASSGGRLLSILLGDGRGNFSAAPQVVFFIDVNSVAVGDFNEDGNKDLAVANGTANTVSILFGDGAGNFGGNTIVSIPDSPNKVYVGDFNNDGNQDLATAGAGSQNTVSVRLGDGTGNFSGSTNLFFSGRPSAVGIGDFNNDGNQDLAVFIANLGVVAIRVGDDSGNFTSIPNVVVNRSPFSSSSDIAIGDFNNDGKQDFAVNDFGFGFPSAGEVAIRLNRCVGPPTPTPTPPLPTLGNYPNTTVTVGTNTTITPDAAPTGATKINVSTDSNFKGLLAANPTTGVIRVTNAHPAGTYLVTVTAFNAGGMTTKTFTLTVGSGPTCSGTIQFTNAADLSLIGISEAVALGDFNNDGIQDIAHPSYNMTPEREFVAPLVAIRYGNGSGGFSNAANIGLGVPGLTAPLDIAIGDFNNDGNQDFMTANINGRVSIRLGNGVGGFATLINISIPSQLTDIVIGDFNNDGKQDFAVVGSNSTVYIRLGDGLGGFSGSTEILFSSVSDLAIGDFNSDGNEDLAVANNSVSGMVSIRLGDGLGGFSETTEISVGNSPRSIAIGDFNNDGKQDFATANNGSNNVSIRLGNGFGGFSGTTEVSVGTQPTSIKIGDFNNDGKQDVATTNSGSSTVSIRLGDGLGNFSVTTEVSVSSNPAELAIGDFNNDGTQDFATANAFSTAASIRLGGCSVMPTPITISGRVTYPIALNTTGVPFTTITAAGSIPLSTMTDANGFYSISGFGAGAYTITPSKANQVNGISNLDASTVALFVAGLITLSANEQIAADTSGNGAISSLDAAYIAQFVASIPNPGITGTWKFVPASRSYPNVLSNQPYQDYNAILVGEVTRNWSPTGPLHVDLSNWNPAGALRFDLSAAKSDLATLTEKAAQEEGVTVTASANESAGEETALTIDLTAGEIMDEGILGYQFDLLYDKEVIEPQAIGCDVTDTISNGMTAICHAVEPGVMKVVVFGAKPISGTGTLLRMNFKVVGARGARLPLTIKNFMFNEELPTAVTVNERW